MPWSVIRRRNGAPIETLPGRNAGTDQGTAVNDRGRGNSRRLPPGKVRKGRSGRRWSGRACHPTAFLFRTFYGEAGAARPSPAESGYKGSIRLFVTGLCKALPNSSLCILASDPVALSLCVGLAAPVGASPFLGSSVFRFPGSSSHDSIQIPSMPRAGQAASRRPLHIFSMWQRTGNASPSPAIARYEQWQARASPFASPLEPGSGRPRIGLSATRREALSPLDQGAAPRRAHRDGASGASPIDHAFSCLAFPFER